MITSLNLPWIGRLLLLLTIAVTLTDAKKRVVYNLRRWESTGIVNCTGASFEFACKDDPKKILPQSQRCDGVAQCKDKSDERKCMECRTPYSFNGTDGFRVCVTAQGMRVEDTEWQYHSIYPKCVNGEREKLKRSWRDGCAEGEKRCSRDSICVPARSVCDGVEDCGTRTEYRYSYDWWNRDVEVSGEDESCCASCTGGARMCEPTEKCIPAKSICDGKRDCSDGSDEKDCTCETCNGALCGDGKCIKKNQVCDGIMDCQDASDEQNCPTSCGAIVDANSTLPQIITAGYYALRRYSESEACSGAFEDVGYKCPENDCDCRVAFKCNSYYGGGKCIPKAKVCDGVRDCSDGSDEQNCLKACAKYPFFTCVNKLRVKCMTMEHKCDGVRDCLDGSDEKKCDKCPSDAHKCDGGCLPSSLRCNGVKDCKDGSDEKNCTCEECIEGHMDTYSCEATRTCMKKSAACGPHSRCPKPTARDELFCVRQSQINDKYKGYSSDEASRYWDRSEM